MWVLIPGFEDYLINEYGKIFSFKTYKIIPGYLSRGYLAVNLSNKSLKKAYRYFKIHQIVALTFYGERPSWAQGTRHLDGNKLNNYYKNLCYGTQKENMQDAVRHGTRPRGSKMYNACMTEELVLKIMEDGKNGLSFSQIGRKYNINRKTIFCLFKRKNPSWGWLTKDHLKDYYANRIKKPHPMALTEEKVLEIIKLKKEGLDNKIIAKKYRVTSQAVYSIFRKNNPMWRWFTKDFFDSEGNLI